MPVVMCVQMYQIWLTFIEKKKRKKIPPPAATSLPSPLLLSRKLVWSAITVEETNQIARQSRVQNEISYWGRLAFKLQTAQKNSTPTACFLFVCFFPPILTATRVRNTAAAGADAELHAAITRQSNDDSQGRKVELSTALSRTVHAHIMVAVVQGSVIITLIITQSINFLWRQIVSAETIPSVWRTHRHRRTRL